MVSIGLHLFLLCIFLHVAVATPSNLAENLAMSNPHAPQAPRVDYGARALTLRQNPCPHAFRATAQLKTTK
jgi:hypothetical protein